MKQMECNILNTTSAGFLKAISALNPASGCSALPCFNLQEVTDYFAFTSSGSGGNVPTAGKALLPQAVRADFNTRVF